jgi:molecular chaperone Hsp33
VQVLALTLKDEELSDRTLPLSDIMWRLFHDEGEIRVTDPVPIGKGCRCNIDHIRDVIGRFPADERAAMADEDGSVNVDCAFCSRIFPVSLVSLEN